MATKTAGGPAAEIDVMGRISQQAAAWALDCSPRTLRDTPSLKRNPEGTYSVQELVRFARSAGKLPALSDEQFEQCLQIAANLDIDSIAEVKRAVEALVRNVGGDPMMALAAIGLVVWRDSMEHIGIYPESFELGPTRYTRVYVCDMAGCKRYRLGRRWLSGDPPDDLTPIGHICPTCLNGMGRTRTALDPVGEELDVDSEIKPRRTGRRVN